MIIQIESLSKKYLIHHQYGEAYKTLRDKLSEKTLNLFGKRPEYKPDDVEEFWALKEINLTIDQGDRVAIIGRNGAGKSTLLKILSRITPPTSGRIEIRGRVASLLEVGTGFHPELTGRENIFLNGALLGMTKHEIRKKFDEIVEFADIERFLDTPVKRYSSGMYVRLAFAVAAHLEPDILFIDEVLAVGDARFQKKCIGKMEEVAKQGRTILFITHNMSTLGFCNKGIYLEQGKLIPTSSINECIAKYQGFYEQEKPETHWSGDEGDRTIRIQSLKIASNDHSGIFKKSCTGTIEVIFKALEPVHELFVGFFIINKYGSVILHHGIIGEEDKYPFEVQPGVYKIETEIDFNHFSDGIYRLVLDLGIHNVKRISSQDTYVTFEVVNTSKRYGEPPHTLAVPWESKIQKIPVP
jgi:lipopolysaccharide transport system ATP-binding protein